MVFNFTYGPLTESLTGTYGTRAGSTCQNIDGLVLTYGQTYGALTGTYGTAARASLKNIQIEILTGTLTNHLRVLTVLRPKPPFR